MSVVSRLLDSKMQHSSGENRIFEAAENCEQLFTQCYDAQNRQPDTGWPHLIANQHGRYRVWSENIGIYAAEKASLDYRLRDSPTVARMVLDQLSNLSFHLENIINLQSGETETQATDEMKTPEDDASDTSQDSESENESSGSIRDIDASREAIDRLNRLSLAIRRQSVIQRNSRAAYYEEEDENGVPKVWTFNVMAQRMVITWYPNASKIIQHRLAETMTIRRRQLLYRQSHQQKLKGQGGRQNRPNRNQFVTENSAGITHSPSSNYGYSNKPTQSTKSVSSSKAESRGKLSATQASTMVESKVQFDAPSSKASTAMSAAVSDFERLEPPKPPKPSQGHSEFACPYCCMVVPIKEAEEKNWK